MVELLMVLLIIGVLAAVSVPYFFSYTKLYRSDDQALKVIDLMQEASQRALSRRHTVRFELDLTDNAVLIIDENLSGPDQLVKLVPLLPREAVRVDAAPPSVSAPNPPNYAAAVFASDSMGHERDGTSVSGHTVWAVRFRRDGSARSVADNPMNASLFIWAPKADDIETPNTAGEIRAITVFSGTGAVRFWKYDGTTFRP